ncbi:MAG TPA: LCP family protein [Acidimicrobiales bacterium]|nr:LCP family protein [Acidimicrobiales bacterium]
MADEQQPGDDDPDDLGPSADADESAAMSGEAASGEAASGEAASGHASDRAPDAPLPAPGTGDPAGETGDAVGASRRRGHAAPRAGWRARRRARVAARSRLRRNLTRTAIGLVLVVVVIAGAVTGYGAYRIHQIHRVAAHHLTPTTVTGPTENILLIGSTNRCAVKGLANFVAQCKAGVTGINSDVVMVLRLVPADHRVALLSIPRDTFVPGARAGGLYNKIDASLVDGPNQLAAAIQQDFGIPINHFVELNFGTFANVVSALGGIRMYFPDRLYDANSDLDITRTGCQYLNGVQALELVRSRHLYYFTKGQKMNVPAIRAAGVAGTYYTPNSGGQYDGSGDLGRITRVHAFVRVLATEIAKRGLGNPLTDNALIGAIAPDLTVDSTFGATEMLRLALDFRHANFGTAPQLTAPIVVNAATYYYKGYNYGDVVFPTQPQDSRTIAEFMGHPAPGLALHPASISVSVVDGTNSSAATAATSARLRALGYRIVPTSASEYVGPVSETTVRYAAGHLDQAERVMASLSGTVVLGQGTPAAGADVSVIAGSDLTVASPAPAAAKTGAVGSTAPGATTASTAVPVTTTTNPNFSAPTPATPPVPPYDPRAC